MFIKKPKSHLVVTRYKEDINWLINLTDNYTLYNKGEKLKNCKQIMKKNYGGNQLDIFEFIYDNYENLPDLICFLQGNPFDHCVEELFYELIFRNYYTLLFNDPNHFVNNKSNFFQYQEINDDYIYKTEWFKNLNPCKFKSFDDYASSIFKNYNHENVLFFPPGSQLIVEKERCLYYSKSFWKKLIDFIPVIERNLYAPSECHVIERSIQMIFENKYKEL